ncbi:MAG: RES family NAD+ phosphorylase [Acidobacteria bacterium]|nr:RES family NAD+ phosphorylase [Acidobacteriota bacterium]
MSPRQAPPPQYDGSPDAFLLPAGARLTRIHSASFSVTDFNPTVARSPLRGSRFDATPDDQFGFLYAAGDDATAVSEVLLRDLPLDQRGARLLPRARLKNLRIGWLATNRDLHLVDLRSGRNLAAIGQDTWLTAGPACDYELTRAWASAIRAWAPWSSGLTWRSHREPAGFVYVLFEDRMTEACLTEVSTGVPLIDEDRRLDDGIGRIFVERLLQTYRVALI